MPEPTPMPYDGGGRAGDIRRGGHEMNVRHDGHAGHARPGAGAEHARPGGQGGHGPAPAGWGVAVSATLHCLTGCAIGEVLGMVVGTALGWSNAPTIVLAVVLAFFFGYALTLRGLRRARVGLRRALRLALAADTLSIAVMELVDNAVMIAVPGAMDAPLSSALFWGALALALLVAFLVTAPINKWVIGRGKGHAVIHAYHH